MGWAKIVRSAQKHNPPVYRNLLLQLFLATALGVASYFYSWHAAVSIFVGAFIGIASNLAAAAWFFKSTVSARKPRAILRMAYVSEVIKLLTTVLLFVFALSATDIWLPLFLFGGYLAALLVNWLTPWLMGSH